MLFAVCNDPWYFEKFQGWEIIHVWNHQSNITMLQFALFHNAKYYTNYMLSCIHVNTTKLCNISCTLVATCLILQGFRVYLDCFRCSPTSTNYITQQNSCCISKCTIKHLQRSNWKSNLPLLNINWWKCMFVDFLTWYIGPPNYVHYWVYTTY